MPKHLSTAKQKVAFVLGNAFYADGSGQNTMRLNFSNATPDKIREGIRGLKNVPKLFVKEPVHSV